MPLGPLGVTALLGLLDWVAWDWAANNNHSTIGLIAALLMAPIAVAFAWSLVRVLVGLGRMAVHRAAVEVRAAVAPLEARAAPERPFDIEAEEGRIAA
jgi:hypothetical protein